MKRVLFSLLALLSSGCLLASGLLSKECGDGFVDAGEACDDANDTNGDGCDSDCSISCGNAVVTAPETCDDGNTTPGDGCSPDCSQEIVELTLANINGENIDTATFAVFSTRVEQIDTDADAIPDTDLGVLQVVISDKPDICDILAQDPLALQSPNPVLQAQPALRALVLQGFRRAPLGSGDFFTGEELSSNTSVIDAVFGTGADTSSVNASVFIQSGGAALVFANTPAFATTDGVLSLTDISETLTAQMTMTITAEHVNGPFDAQDNPLDNDQTLDIRTISKPLTVSIQNISRCESF